jgi:hypothetical protein
MSKEGGCLWEELAQRWGNIEILQYCNFAKKTKHETRQTAAGMRALQYLLHTANSMSVMLRCVLAAVYSFSITE